MENIGLVLNNGLFLVELENPINIDPIYIIKWNRVIIEKNIVEDLFIAVEQKSVPKFEIEIHQVWGLLNIAHNLLL